MKLAFLFPGQGTQKVGMARDLYDRYEDFRAFFDDVKAWTGIDLSQLVFEENDKINETQFTQLAILSVELATLRLVKKAGIRADAVAGYSLGEYAALVACGVLSEEDAIKLIVRRGYLMANTVPCGVGGMAAVLGMDSEEVEKVLENYGNVRIVNYNTASQVSISGVREDVDRACEALRAAGARKVVSLNVSGPFHSSLLEPASREFAGEFAKVALNAPVIPYYPNVTAMPKSDADGISELLCRQISSPVLWYQTIGEMRAAGFDTFVEIGPGKVLRGFFRGCDEGIRLYGSGTMTEFEALCGEFCDGK